MKFVLTIDLGNEAMSIQDDIARALISLARSLIDYEKRRTPEVGDSGPLYDVNGNRVGGWHVE